jgi:cell division protein FtsI/penicillin-binding protein 2
LAAALAPHLGLEAAWIASKLEPKLFQGDSGQMRTNRYVVLKRKMPREKWEEIAADLKKLDLGVDESGLTRKQRQMLTSVRQSIFADRKEDQLRVYPGNRLASHVLGFVGGTDHDGKEGIEAVLDSRLTGTRGWRVTETDSRKREVVSLRHQDVAARNGLNARLTIDLGVQHIVEAELDQAMQRHQPQGITAVVVRPATGEVLAMANRPDFDPNRPGEFPAANRRNRAVTDTAEPGSTFKAVTVAGAINERLVSLESRFDCENGIFYHGGRPLRDHHPYSRLSVKEIITKSSNIGSAKVAMMLGQGHLHHYIRRFGFGERTRVSLPGEVSGTVHPLKRWNKLSITRVPMGHEVATTPIQMAMMASAIANGGKLMRPMLMRQLEDEAGRVVVQYHPEAVRQVVTPETARRVTEALKTVVEPGGTARRAALEYYSVAGKTGTAQKAGRGGYIPGKYYSSFVGFFPAEQPALCIYVALDEPTGDYYGGLTAAPIFKAIAERSASYLGVKPDLVEQGSMVSSNSEGP